MTAEPRTTSSRRSLELFQPLGLLCREQIPLVPELDQTPLINVMAEIEIGQYRQNVIPLRIGFFVRNVAHVNDEIGGSNLLQRGPEGGDQIRWQIGDKAHRVGQDGRPGGGQRELSHGGIERGEQLILCRHPCPGQPIEQRRLAGIGVADQGDHRIRHPAARGAMQPACAFDRFKLAFDARDALVDAPAIELDLAFTRTTDEAHTATLPLQMGPGSNQAGTLIAERCQFHLQTTFLGLRTGAENLQDQTGPVDHLALERALEIALLDGRECCIDDQKIDLVLFDAQRQLHRHAQAQSASPDAVWRKGSTRHRRHRDRRQRQSHGFGQPAIVGAADCRCGAPRTWMKDQRAAGPGFSFLRQSV